ncbi:shikimate dehydrogenase [Solimicrobium silvestre]|uniref:Shikimate dehydrogenase (NADP(+)) n=1 Tax=Solimicrobium silvestre TaxID=2099400 RepID=A0A2S9GUF9_9BURK|nr:shikimate dehydrogenase [Solimicrobium silvestre]PRC91350.1 aroE: shikimate 5-dehydrogenase [Solimicrobium silvestre]
MQNKASQPLDQYAVIGNPVAHSKSPLLHAAFAAQCQQAICYRALLAPPDSFAATVKQFINDGGRGANVTLPFKLEAFNLCTALTPRAQAAGAVNTMCFEGQKIIGDNTDGCGLVSDIVRNAGVTLQGKRILLLGAGGAARGAILPLLECQPAELIIANRSIEKAQQLAEQFSSFGQISSSEFAQIKGQFDVIINATSASIAAQIPPIPDTAYNSNSLAYDMMYSDQPTVFMQHAAKHQAQTRDGWGMLVEQAAEAFYVWRGMRPDTSELLTRNMSRAI